MRNLLLLGLFICVYGLVSGSEDPEVHGLGSPKYPALLCSECGFGSQKDNCLLCGKWVGSTSYPARLCSSCGFGSKKNVCVRCGKWVGMYGVPAKLCSNCGFGSKGKNCVKCGKFTLDHPACPCSCSE